MDFICLASKIFQLVYKRDITSEKSVFTFHNDIFVLNGSTFLMKNLRRSLLYFCKVDFEVKIKICIQISPTLAHPILFYSIINFIQLLIFKLTWGEQWTVLSTLKPDKTNNIVKQDHSGQFKVKNGTDSRCLVFVRSTTLERNLN